MDKRLESIRKRLAEIRIAREKKAAELAAAQRKAAEEAAAEARRAAAQRAAAESVDNMTHEEYARAFEACQEIELEARDDLRAFAETILRAFYEARLDYEKTIEETEGVILELYLNMGLPIPPRDENLAKFLFVGDPNTPPRIGGKNDLWNAVSREFPRQVISYEYIPPRNIYDTPTARSRKEVEELKKRGVRQFTFIESFQAPPVPEELLDPSIKWMGGSVEEVKTPVSEVPDRMDYEGNIQTGNVLGTDGRVIHPPKKEE